MINRMGLLTSDGIGSCLFRTEPKKLRTDSNRADLIFKTLKPNRIEPNRTEHVQMIKAHSRLSSIQIHVLCAMIFYVQFI